MNEHISKARPWNAVSGYHGPSDAAPQAENLEHFHLTFAHRFDLGTAAFRRVVLAAQNAGQANHDVLAARRNPRGRTPRYRQTFRENALGDSRSVSQVPRR